MRKDRAVTLPRNLWDRLRCVVWSWLPVLVRKTKHSISSRRESTVWIFLPSFFSPIIKIFLGEIWLDKNSTFLWKNPTDRRLPHSNVSDLRDNQPRPCWLSVYLLPIIWKATALVLSMTAWPHLVRRESELQTSCLKKGCSLDVHSSCCCYSSRGSQKAIARYSCLKICTFYMS